MRSLNYVLVKNLFNEIWTLFNLSRNMDYYLTCEHEKSQLDETHEYKTAHHI